VLYFVHHTGCLSKDVYIEAFVLTPLALLLGNPYVKSSTSKASESLISLFSLQLALVLMVGEVWVPSALPLSIDLEKKDAIRVSTLVVNTLELSVVYLILVPVRPEDRSSLRVKTAHHNSLMHAFHHHSN